MRICCDMDDILCETAATLCTVAEREFGARVAYADVREFDLQKVFGLTDGQMRRFMEVSHLPDCLLSYPETRGAVAGVRALAAAGHRVEIVTGRPSSSYRATEAWLRTAGLGDLPVTYVDKYGRAYATDGDAPAMVTLDELRRRRYDIVIDDSPVVLPRFASWLEARVLVFDRPWNVRFPLAANMVRVDGWAGILRELLAS